MIPFWPVARFNASVGFFMSGGNGSIGWRRLPEELCVRLTGADSLRYSGCPRTTGIMRQCGVKGD